MSNIKHQVFLSSTNIDLGEAKSKVITALIMSDCFVDSMEYFPATNEEQIEFVKSLIDQCDYYILIIGRRYGSIHKSGKSFTEEEFDYAVAKNKPVAAFVCRNPDSLPEVAAEPEDHRRLLTNFVAKVSSDRVVTYWDNPDDLSTQVLLTMLRMKKVNPSPGWVRADSVRKQEVMFDSEAVQDDFLRKIVLMRYSWEAWRKRDSEFRTSDAHIEIVVGDAAKLIIPQITGMIPMEQFKSEIRNLIYKMAQHHLGGDNYSYEDKTVTRIQEFPLAELHSNLVASKCFDITSDTDGGTFVSVSREARDYIFSEKWREA
jgi:nucleoside 2-deoxyribosyltransferase